MHSDYVIYSDYVMHTLPNGTNQNLSMDDAIKLMESLAESNSALAIKCANELVNDPAFVTTLPPAFSFSVQLLLEELQKLRHFRSVLVALVKDQ